LTRATQHLPAATVAQAEPVLLEAARRLDPPRLRKVVGHLCEVADPDAAEQQAQRRHDRRGLWLTPTFAGMVAVDGLLDAEAGETLLTALEPLARPSTADDDRTAAHRRADALTELARRQLEGGRLPQSGGVRPQVSVTIDLAALRGEPGLPGAEGGWVGPLPAETARRLACDAAVTRVLVTRHPHHPVGDGDHHQTGPGDYYPLGADDRHLGYGVQRQRRPRRRAGRPAAYRHDAAAPGAGWRPHRSRWRWAAPPGWSPLPNAAR
jgi:hypothetical protein